MSQPVRSFDVLVIGSGAAGLAAAVSAERAGARVALATKGSLQANNSSKAQGGIQAALGADDSPEQHADDVFRCSHDTADRTLRRGADRRRAVGDPLARAARRRVHARVRRQLPARPLRRRDARSACCRSATAPATRSRTGCAMRGTPERHESDERAADGAGEPQRALARARRGRERRGRHRRAGRRRALLRRGRAPRRALDQPARRHRRGDAHRASTLGASRDLDALQYHPNGGAWPPNVQGYSIPETTRAYGAVLVNAQRRAVHRRARPARRRQPGDRRRGATRAAAWPRRTAARRSTSTRRASRAEMPRCRCPTCCAATATPGSTR